MTRKKLGKRHYTEAEKASYLSEFRKSGLSLSEFGRAHNLSPSTLHCWLGKSLRRKAPLSSTASKPFVELQPEATTIPETKEISSNRERLYLGFFLGNVFRFEYERGRA